MSMSANQKSGSAIPNIAPVVASISMMEFRFSAAITPAITPSASDSAKAARANCSVCGSRLDSSWATGRLFWNDLPQSPVTKSPIQFRYWMGSGLSSPRSRIMTARISGVNASLSSPAIEYIGSLGRILTSANIIRLMMNSVGIMCRSRLAMYLRIWNGELGGLHPVSRIGAPVWDAPLL